MEINDEQMITNEDFPKRILNDFHFFLDYVSQNKIKLTKLRAYLPRKDLKIISDQLTEYQPPAPEKGNQNKYPLVHLLFHLALSLRLAKKTGNQSVKYLQVDEALFDVYKNLNASEQYVTLLEAFWMKADWEEIQHELYGITSYNTDLLLEYLEEELPFNKVLKINDEDLLEGYLRGYEYFLYYFSYFGFWEVEIEIVSLKNAYNPGYMKAKSIKLNPLLEKLIPSLLDTWNKHDEEAEAIAGMVRLFGLDSDYIDEEEDEYEDGPAESLFVLLQPLFAQGELKNTLPKPERAEPLRGNITFKVNLYPDCWRRIQLPGYATLSDLHEWIQKAFDFDDDHLYAFFMDGKRFSKHSFKSPMDIHGPYADEIELGQLQMYEGQEFLYLFDYGRSWEFLINVEKIAEEEETGALILKKEGADPVQYE